MRTAVFALAFLTSCSSAVGNKSRLTGLVKPTFYTIQIDPNLGLEVFAGHVIIKIHIEYSLKFFELHSSNLTISDIHLDGVAIGSQQLGSQFFYKFCDHELLRIESSHDVIGSGSHTLSIRYSGKLSKNEKGIIKTGFTKNNETLSSLVATSFQPTFARRMFPCFDEPSFKAKFQLNVLVPDLTYNAISNMRIASVVSTSKGRLFKFETTKQMSTYLLALVVSQYTYKEYFGRTQIPFRIYSYNNSQETDKALLSFADDVLEFLQDYTQARYTLPKIDFVEFDKEGSAASENWGLITLATGLVSSDEILFDKGQKLNVIAHELAHFWFGNLVTNTWWDDVWLHEGFAVFMGLKAEDTILKNEAIIRFKSEYVEDLFVREVHNESRAVITSERNPTLKETFNDFTYNKGASVLQMLELAMGEDRFKHAVGKYICRFSEKSASTSDFLEVVEEVYSDIRPRQMAETYLYQNLFPVVYVEEFVDHYKLRQSACKTSRNVAFSSLFNYKWTIPITYITDEHRAGVFTWFDKDMDYIIVNKSKENWIKFNFGHIGYYRVNYDNTLWNKLLTHHEQLDNEEKKFLLLNAIGLFEINEISCDVAIRFLENSKDLNIEIAYLVYLKVKMVIQQLNGIFKCLKVVFYNLLKKHGYYKLSDRILRDSPNGLSRNVYGDKIQECGRWLLNNCSSYEFGFEVPIHNN